MQGVQPRKTSRKNHVGERFNSCCVRVALGVQHHDFSHLNTGENSREFFFFSFWKIDSENLVEFRLMLKDARMSFAYRNFLQVTIAGSDL